MGGPWNRPLLWVVLPPRKGGLAVADLILRGGRSPALGGGCRGICVMAIPYWAARWRNPSFKILTCTRVRGRSSGMSGRSYEKRAQSRRKALVWSISWLIM